MTILFRLLGLLICGLVVARLIVYLTRSILGVSGEQSLRNLRIEKLRAEVDALRSTKKAQQESATAWDGFRKFRVVKKTAESTESHSFYLAPHDGRSLPAYQPGQYLTFKLKIPGQKKPVVRCYSLSGRYDERFYRCTIKRMMPPPDKQKAPAGVSSSYFNDVVSEGDILDVKSPRGKFVLDEQSDAPVVLIAGGVGITPLMAMAQTLLAAGSTRPIFMFAGCPNSQTQIFRSELQQADRQHSATFRLINCYSDPLADDKLEQDYQVAGRITLDVVQSYLPSTNCDFYICGPSAMMVDMTEQLAEWGVEPARIHTEAFGPSSVKKKPPNPVPVSVAAGVGDNGVAIALKDPGGAVEACPPSESPSIPAAGSEQRLVNFEVSRKQVPWSDQFSSLLEFAEANNVDLDSGCRAGNCGTCLTAIKSGKVKYVDEAGAECEDGTCLPCVCVPDGPVVLDA